MKSRVRFFLKILGISTQITHKQVNKNQSCRSWWVSNVIYSWLSETPYRAVFSWLILEKAFPKCELLFLWIVMEIVNDNMPDVLCNSLFLDTSTWSTFYAHDWLKLDLFLHENCKGATTMSSNIIYSVKIYLMRHLFYNQFLFIKRLKSISTCNYLCALWLGHNLNPAWWIKEMFLGKIFSLKLFGKGN